jgi:hypothetical protein
MKKKQKQQIILLAVFIPIFVIIYIVDQQITKSRSKQLNLEYPRIVYEDSINGVVTDIYHPKGYRVFPYFLRIEMNNAKKKSLGITPDSLTLTETLKVGSRILKKSNAYDFEIINIDHKDTIIYSFRVYKDTSVFNPK